jgi:hypothetical protein
MIPALPKPEVIEGLTHSAYSKIEAEHSGVLKQILVSPLAYKHAKDQEALGADEDRDVLRLGRAVHTAVLEPHRLAQQYVCWAAGRRSGKEWEAFSLDSADKTVLKEDQLDLAVSIAKSVRSHPVSGPMLTAKGRAELTIVWTHPRTGIRIKCRLDWLTDALLLDLKTTRDVSPARFCSQAAQLGYHTQMALYTDAVYAAGLGPVATKIVAVQSTAPHDVVCYSLDEDALGPGRERYEAALDLIVKHRVSGVWPGMAMDEELELNLPTWAVGDAQGLVFDDE